MVVLSHWVLLHGNFGSRANWYRAPSNVISKLLFNSAKTSHASGSPKKSATHYLISSLESLCEVYIVTSTLQMVMQRFILGCGHSVGCGSMPQPPYTGTPCLSTCWMGWSGKLLYYVALLPCASDTADWTSNGPLTQDHPVRLANDQRNFPSWDFKI